MLAGSGLATAGAGGRTAGVGRAGAAPPTTGPGVTEPFHGAHQSGIATPEQARLAFAAFDVTGTDRAGLVDLLATWTEAAEQMTGGHAVDGPSGPFAPPADTGEALGPSACTADPDRRVRTVAVRRPVRARRPASRGVGRPAGLSG